MHVAESLPCLARPGLQHYTVPDYADFALFSGIMRALLDVNDTINLIRVEDNMEGCPASVFLPDAFSEGLGD